MNRKQRTKLIAVTSIIAILGIAVGLVLYALKQNINLFYTPTQLLEVTINPEQQIRIGGYVKKQSVAYDTSGESVSFVITDRKNEIKVTYHGVLPNLFREGQGVVVSGRVSEPGLLTASEVLAKHDEKYMPKAVADAIKKEENHAA